VSTQVPDHILEPDDDPEYVVKSRETIEEEYLLE
jgi:hypothetical protein